MVKNNSFKEIWDKLKKSKKVAITLHCAPDGDSLGCCAAMKYVLERDLKCKVTLISYDRLDETLMTFAYINEIKFGTDITDLNLKDYDVTLFLDSGGTISGKLKESYVPPKDAFIINIDHHPTNPYNVSLNYIDESALSCCSVLMDMFKSMNVCFDKELSTRLLLGLATDSGFFIFNPNKAISEAFYLINNGGDYESIVSRLIHNVPLKMKKYHAFLTNNLKIININNKIIGYVCLSSKDIKAFGLNSSEVRLGINQISDIKELDVAFTLADLGDHIKGSFRSRKNIDVSTMAIALGGGGHKAAAAFRLEKITLKNAEKKVLSLLKENL